jgi:hypothetical protein
MTPEPKRTYSRPRDESLQAFKDWIGGIFTAITGKRPEEAPEQMTEEQWIARWRKFWGKVESQKADDAKDGSK